MATAYLVAPFAAVCLHFRRRAIQPCRRDKASAFFTSGSTILISESPAANPVQGTVSGTPRVGVFLDALSLGRLRRRPSISLKRRVSSFAHTSTFHLRFDGMACHVRGFFNPLPVWAETLSWFPFGPSRRSIGRVPVRLPSPEKRGGHRLSQILGKSRKRVWDPCRSLAPEPHPILLERACLFANQYRLCRPFINHPWDTFHGVNHGR